MKAVNHLPNKFLLTAAILFSFIGMNAQWTNINSSSSYYRIKFVNSSVGYIQDNYSMAKTIDAGVTWTTIDNNSTTYTRTDMYWLNANEGFVLFYENLGFGNYAGWFRKTSNGGASWTNLSQLPVNDLYSAIWFTSSTTGYVVGRNGRILKTVNGGSTWTSLNSGTTEDLYTIFFVSPTTAFVGGHSGVILKTTNSGTNWTQQFNNINWEFNDFWFTDANNGMAVGTYGMMRTTNGGSTWTPITGTQITQFNAVMFPTPDTGYVAAIGGTVLRTTDGGLTWLALNQVGNNGYFIRDVYFTSKDTGYVAEDFTGLWKTNNAGTGCPSLFVNYSTSGDTVRGCAGSNVTFTVAASAYNPYVYSFSPPGYVTHNYGMYYLVNDPAAGDTLSITVTMTDTLTGCAAQNAILTLVTDSITYQPVPGGPTILVYLCPGDSIDLDLGANAQDGYLWLTTGDTTRMLTVDTTGLFQGFAYACGGMAGTIYMVQWDTNCSSFVCGVDAGPDTVFCQLQGQLTANPASAGNYTFSWSPAYGLDNPSAQNPNVVTGLVNQQYVVTMTDTANNCTATDTVVVSAYYFHIDSVYICNGQPVTLDFGPGATNYYWQFFTDTSGNQTFININTQTLVVNQPGTYLGFATFPGCGALTSLFTVIDSCNVYVPNVWPGDCNYDLTANMADALHIGLGYNTSGAQRPNASNGWYAQPMNDWPQNFANCNYKHADTDGNGLIDVNDTVAIAQNYSLVHPFRLGAPPVATATAPTLELVANYDTCGLQTLVTVDIRLGTSAIPVDSIYGISFRITSDALLIDTTLTAVNLNNTWLGIPGNNMFSFRKHFPSAAIMDIAEVGNNHQNRQNGSGSIGSFLIVTTDNLSGIAICHFDLSDVTVVTASQQYPVVNTVNDSVVIDPSLQTGARPQPEAAAFACYPNPASESVTVQTKTIAERIEICDMTGRVMGTVKPSASSVKIDTASLAPGLYLLRVHNGNSVSTQKITIAH